MFYCFGKIYAAGLWINVFYCALRKENFQYPIFVDTMFKVRYN